MLPMILQSLVSIALAIAFAVLAAIAIFFAPVFVYGSDEILLLWGWIAPFVALPSAWLVGRAVRKVLSLAMPRAPYSKTYPLRFIVTASASATLAGASSYFMMTYGDQDFSWSEQVMLRDGSKLLIGRSVSGNSFGRSRRRPEDWLPSSFGIDVSTSEQLSGSPVWRSSLRPILIDKIDGGSLVLVSEPKTCGEWTELGKPNPPFFAYGLRGRKWVPLQIPEELFGRGANLLQAPRFTGEQPVVDPIEVIERNNVGPKDSWTIIQKMDRYC